MYNKTIIEFGFCDIRNNQGRGKCNQPRLITFAETLIIPDITKASSNYCLELQVFYFFLVLSTNRAFVFAFFSLLVYFRDFEMTPI